MQMGFFAEAGPVQIFVSNHVSGSIEADVEKFYAIIVLHIIFHSLKMIPVLLVLFNGDVGFRGNIFCTVAT